MTATILDGAAIAREVRGAVAERVARLAAERGAGVGLATVLVGNDPASEVYVASKRRLARAAGIVDIHRRLPETATQDEVAEVLDALAADPEVSGILLQLPLPAGLRSGALIDRIPPGKDVDGLTTASAGLLARGEPGLRPCTPSGVIHLLRRSGVSLAGSRVVVVGRSELVGRPMAALLLEQDATVTVAHSRTRELAAVTREADVLVVAAGVPGLIGREHVRPGAVVVDVGIHRTPEGLHGDVRSDEVAECAAALTPVPGGVGPMTIAMLLANTVTAAELGSAGRAPGGPVDVNPPDSVLEGAGAIEA